jgi:hypothetical protein
LQTDDPPIFACIAEMRVGLQDDIAFTEVAFLNDDVAGYPHYNAEAPSTSAGDNEDAASSLVWPRVARLNDTHYLIGDDFALYRNGVGTIGIAELCPRVMASKRPHRTYDHRLIRLGQDSDNSSIATRLGVPRSTAVGRVWTVQSGSQRHAAVVLRSSDGLSQ